MDIADDFLFSLFLSEMNHRGPGRAVALFFASKPEDDDTLATVLVTFPAGACASYSLGALISWLHRRKFLPKVSPE
jgi:hypothetical protein